jgi:hypothetical protein
MLGILKWRMRKKISEWRKSNEFGWATTPTNVNAFHTFQANAISKYLFFLRAYLKNIHMYAVLNSLTLSVRSYEQDLVVIDVDEK